VELGARGFKVVKDMGIQYEGGKPTWVLFKPPYPDHDSNLMEPSHVRNPASAICHVSCEVMI
jgi:hypothetical protein